MKEIRFFIKVKGRNQYWAKNSLAAMRVELLGLCLLDGFHKKEEAERFVSSHEKIVALEFSIKEVSI